MTTLVKVHEVEEIADAEGLMSKIAELNYDYGPMAVETENRAAVRLRVWLGPDGKAILEVCA